MPRENINYLKSQARRHEVVAAMQQKKKARLV